MKETELRDALGNVKLSDEARKRILTKCMKKEKCNMKFSKKFGFIAAAAVFVLGLTVYAASGRIVSMHSSSWKVDYKTLPTEAKCEKDVGYTPILIDTFTNGYAFESGRITDNDFRDEEDNSVEKFRAFAFAYKKDSGRVDFYQQKYASDLEDDDETATVYNGIEIKYHSHVNKFVPAGYKLTDEDKRAEAAGELVFSYGSAEVEVLTVQDVSWTVGDMHYELLNMDGALTKDELAAMACEAIDAM